MAVRRPWGKSDSTRKRNAPVPFWARGFSIVCRKAVAVKLTLDSSEPLEDAMRVLGALYGVKLVVDTDGQPAADHRNDNRSGRIRRTRGGSIPAQRAVRSNNAEIRTWARHHGLSINDRGRIPATVKAAYRDAHTQAQQR
jgi:hypothetical protein